ncbi:MAG: MBL fold metallo-hydrolase [Saprospirales bacterium]|nr:MBL fold metallo-hydrolase [Saprospirales bacterium]
MKLQICGAAQTVTGSCHFITLDNGYKILLDCGLYQGHEDELEDFNSRWLFKPSDIDVLVLSHAHIDHCGRIPKLVKDGFRGQIICTSATRDLSSIMLLDSAHIQESDAKHDSKRQHKNIKPLYTEKDSKICLRYFTSIEYDIWHPINEFVKVQFLDAGHILGSASVTLKITENNKETVFGFSGDVGRYNRPVLKDPVQMPALDYLICESTYGGKKHEETPESDEKFLQIIKDTILTKKGKLIIPAFSIGRTQEILYRLDKLYTEGRLENIKVFVDSPIAINATDVFIMHPECFDEEMHQFLMTDDNPFGWKNMKYVKTVEESKALNESNQPCMIIAGSGMANAGRVKHHIFHQVDQDKNTILIVGYCADGTIGQRLIQKPETIKIFGIEKKVAAQIEVMSSMSAHADEPELLQFVSNQDKEKLKSIFLVHGELKRQEAFKTALQNNNFKKIIIPELGDEFEL